MEQAEEPIQIISKDVLALIPKFDGDQNLLTLFIKKVEYVLSNFGGPKNDKQATYVFHAVTSRLRGTAAALLSESDDITTWEQLKEILTQHYGDPRTEESLAIELENLKIHINESYLEFYRRIQQTRSTLLSKISDSSDERKSEKRVIYNNLALNVFLYNLNEDLFRIVRVKNCNTLDKALKIVMEEVNFHIQYNAKNKGRFVNIGAKQKAPWDVFNHMPGQNFRFGIPQPTQNNFRAGMGFGASNANIASTSFGSAAPQSSGTFGTQSASHKPTVISGLFGGPSSSQDSHKSNVGSFVETIQGFNTPPNNSNEKIAPLSSVFSAPP